MIDVKCCFILCLSVNILGGNTKKVSFIDPCHWKDKVCILKSVKKAMPFVLAGVPELGMPSLNPLILKHVNEDNGDLKIELNDVTIYGYDKCRIISFERPEKLKITATVACPSTVTGNYILDGKLFVLPISGNDTFEIKTDEIRYSFNINLALRKKGGKDYYTIVKFDYKYNPVKKFYIHLKNLFNGDKLKADPINTILDESWEELAVDILNPLIRNLLQHFFKIVVKIITQIPADEIEIS